MTKKTATKHILYSLAAAASGAIFISWPLEIFAFIGYILGGALIALGAYLCVRFFVSRGQPQHRATDLFFGIVSLVFGIVLLAQPAYKAALSPIVVGLFELLCAVYFVKFAIESKSGSFRLWWIPAILSLLLAAGAAISIFVKFTDTALLMRLAGSFLAFTGVFNMILSFMSFNEAKSDPIKEQSTPSDPVINDISAQKNTAPEQGEQGMRECTI